MRRLIALGCPVFPAQFARDGEGSKSPRAQYTSTSRSKHAATVEWLTVTLDMLRFVLLEPVYWGSRERRWPTEYRSHETLGRRDCDPDATERLSMSSPGPL